MKVKTKFQRISCYLTLFCLFSIGHITAQEFSGLGAFKVLIEYEGQRFLMDEVYNITPTDFDRLFIEKTIREVDSREGFMFVLTSYIFNNKSGVVITSFNGTKSLPKGDAEFINVHLTTEEFLKLVKTFDQLASSNPRPYEHFLNQFNERLIIDVEKIVVSFNYILWIDLRNRHTFKPDKMSDAVKKHQKFIKN